METPCFLLSSEKIFGEGKCAVRGVPERKGEGEYSFAEFFCEEQRENNLTKKKCAVRGVPERKGEGEYSFAEFFCEEQRRNAHFFKVKQKGRCHKGNALLYSQV